MRNKRMKIRVWVTLWLVLLMIGIDCRSWAGDTPATTPEWELLNACSPLDRQVLLCMLAAGFITTQQVVRRGRQAWIPAHVYRLENIPLARMVYKWTGDRVRISFQGTAAAADACAATQFCEQVNSIIGREKFVVVGDNEPAEIQIIMGKRLFSKDDISLGRVKYSGYCDFSPSDHLPPRGVQVWVQGFRDQTLRDNALRHELMHAIGFPGHSPEADSLIFPVQLCPYEGFTTRRMSKRDERMISLLYQTSIDDGMNLVQVRHILQTISDGNRPDLIAAAGFISRDRE